MTNKNALATIMENSNGFFSDILSAMVNTHFYGEEYDHPQGIWDIKQEVIDTFGKSKFWDAREYIEPYTETTNDYILDDIAVIHVLNPALIDLLIKAQILQNINSDNTDCWVAILTLMNIDTGDYE